jgi:NADH-quinone oxidoreductase subunit F
MLGTACATVFNENTCAVRLAENLARFYWHESCGQCTPCREGTGWMYNILRECESGRATVEGVDLLGSAAGGIMGNTICPFGDGAAMPILSYAKKFRDEFLQHALLGKCPFGGAFPAVEGRSA